MSRLAAGIEYDGSAFHGWQAHRDQRSVQATLEAALGRIAAQPVEVVAAGRTDAGVHALGQVVHFDTGAQRSSYAWLLGTNSQLPADLSLRWIQPVADTFHARHRAHDRRYRYVIHNARARSALLHARAAWWPLPLDAGAMHAAAQQLLGERDFSAFRDSQCQSPTPMRNMKWLRVARRGDFVVIDVCANAFLHHMVRNIAGTLVEVGLGRRPVEWVAEVLDSRDRRRGGMTGPACGLYFVGPSYPAEFALPEPPEAWFPA